MSPTAWLAADPIGAIAEEAVSVVDWSYAIVMGLVEGFTEFLPISSTGHLILTTRLFDRAPGAFEIAIQMGAITAVLLLYWRRLWDALRQLLGGVRRADAEAGAEADAEADAGTGAATAGEAPRVNLLWLILAAALPPAALALVFANFIHEHLMNHAVVGTAMVLGGVVFLVLERWHGKRTEGSYLTLQRMTLGQALILGLFQSLALFPGTSRSGAVMVGALVLGFRRTAAAEFSFLVGLPLLYGASLRELWVHGLGHAPLDEFLIALVASFVSALLVVKPFVHFLRNHTFVPFAWYRIGMGAVVILFLGGS